MALELDVEILDLIHFLGLGHREAIDQILRFDQQAPQIHRMMRRDPEIAPRQIIGECAGLDADRQYVLLAGRKPP